MNKIWGCFKVQVGWKNAFYGETGSRDLSTCLNFEIVTYIKIPTTEAIESNDLNIENW